MIKVWGGKSVANVQKVLWCLAELRIAFEYLGPSGAFSSDCDSSYVESKAKGSVPVMDEDGFVLWEGNAIARYLARKYAAGTLWPADACKAADGERWMDYQLSTVREHIHPILRADLARSEIEHHGRQLATAFDPVETALRGRRYLLGDVFTAADIPLGINAYRWFLLDVERPPVPHIEAWLDALRARPAFRETIIPPAATKVELRSS